MGMQEVSQDNNKNATILECDSTHLQITMYDPFFMNTMDCTQHLLPSKSNKVHINKRSFSIVVVLSALLLLLELWHVSIKMVG